MKQVYVVYRWSGNPEADWYPWLKEELKAEYDVHVLQMPESGLPKVDLWVNHLKETIKNPDQNTYLIGHSVGAQAVLSYMESLPDNVKVGGVILVAPWTELVPGIVPGSPAVTDPWVKTPIHWDKVRMHADRFIAIRSDNDALVPIENIEVFKRELGVQVIIEKGKAHLNQYAGVTALPSVVESLKSLAKVSQG